MKDYIICPNCEGEGYIASNHDCDVSECSACLPTLGRACDECPLATKKPCGMCQGIGKVFEDTLK